MMNVQRVACGIALRASAKWTTTFAAVRARALCDRATVD
jgi:hypothetical protein